MGGHHIFLDWDLVGSCTPPVPEPSNWPLPVPFGGAIQKKSPRNSSQMQNFEKKKYQLLTDTNFKGKLMLKVNMKLYGC